MIMETGTKVKFVFFNSQKFAIKFSETGIRQLSKTQPAFTCSKSAIGTPKQYVKLVQILQ